MDGGQVSTLQSWAAAAGGEQQQVMLASVCQWCQWCQVRADNPAGLCHGLQTTRHVGHVRV